MDITLYGRYVDGSMTLAQVILTTSNTYTTATSQTLSISDTVDRLQPTRHQLDAATENARFYWDNLAEQALRASQNRSLKFDERVSIPHASGGSVFPNKDCTLFTDLRLKFRLIMMTNPDLIYLPRPMSF
jgi:hypothetical protein